MTYHQLRKALAHLEHLKEAENDARALMLGSAKPLIEKTSQDELNEEMGYNNLRAIYMELDSEVE